MSSLIRRIRSSVRRALLRRPLVRRIIGVGRPPAPKALIVAGYWRCDRCGALYGGIKGKGPLRTFNVQGSTCRHAWRAITKDEFRDAAEREFGKDWSTEIPYFQRSGSFN
ncbi:MAG: hypothetical protein AAGE52_42440 [Myxococcota bacterium]